MAKAPKNPKFGYRGGVQADEDCDLVIPIKGAAKRGMWGMRGAYIRNLGVAIVHSSYGGYPKKHIIVYAHSQISNGHSRAWPATGMFLDKEAAEQVATMLLTALAKFDA